MDSNKKRFISKLKGRDYYFDPEGKVIHLFERTVFTMPHAAKVLNQDLDFRMNGRNVFTAFHKSTNEPVLEQINRISFRLLNGWAIAPESRNNVLHAGWTEETNEFEMQKLGPMKVPVRRFRKFLTLENMASSAPPGILEYVANSKDPDNLIRGPLETIKDQDGTSFLHAVVDISESTQVQIVNADTKTVVYTIHLGTVIRDGTLIGFPSK
jgi:hypothetical protein